MESFHYGTKPGHFETSKIHFPTSEGVSEVSERMRERSGGRDQSEQSGASERVSGASERTSEWPSTYVSILVSSRPQWNDVSYDSSLRKYTIHSMNKQIP